MPGGGGVRGMWFGLRTAVRERRYLNVCTLRLAFCGTPQRIRSVLILILLPTLCLSQSQFATAQEREDSTKETDRSARIPSNVPARIGGVVASISSDGLILMTDGLQIRQWGLEITSPIALSNLLLGRELSCSFIYSVSDVYFADCQTFAVSSHTYPRALDLFAWLPELGWAKHTCNLRQHESAAKSEAPIAGDGMFYACSNESVPRRTETERD